MLIESAGDEPDKVDKDKGAAQTVWGEFFAEGHSRILTSGGEARATESFGCEAQPPTSLAD